MSIAEEPLPHDLELSKSLERLGRTLAEKTERERQTATESAPQPKPPAKVVQLPLWPEPARGVPNDARSEEHTSELQSPYDLVCRLLLEKKKKKQNTTSTTKL